MSEKSGHDRGERPWDVAALGFPSPHQVKRENVDDGFPLPDSELQKTNIVRRNLAYATMGFFGIVALLGFYGAMHGEDDWQRTKDWLLIILPVITLLIGGIVGHYMEKHK